MKKWNRWQAWLALAAGAYAALAPLWTETTDAARWTMVVLGVVTAMVAIASMAEDRVSEYALMLLGVLFIASPWVVGFENLDAMALTAWIVGAVTLLAGVLMVPQVEGRMHHHGPLPH